MEGFKEMFKYFRMKVAKIWKKKLERDNFKSRKWLRSYSTNPSMEQEM